VDLFPLFQKTSQYGNPILSYVIQACAAQKVAELQQGSNETSAALHLR
jgi:hypothetical protein